VKELTFDTHTTSAIYGKKNRHLAYAFSSYLALLDDSPLQQGLYGYKPIGLFKKFRDELLKDVKGLVLRYSDLYDQIVRSTTSQGTGSPQGDFVPAMRDTPIFREYHEWYRNGQPHLLTYIGTFLLFLKKVDYYDESFHTTAFRGWIENERKLATLSLPPLGELKTVMHYILQGLVLTNNIGRYGPGQVSERYKGVREKSSSFVLTPKLARMVHSLDARVRPEHLPSYSLTTEKLEDRLRFVPKNLKTSRSMCIQTNPAMFFQQMLLADFEEFLHYRWGHIIDLKDQTFNQDLSLYGSMHGSLDTLDLSSASDLVHTDLVRQVFPRRIWRELLCTRTSSVKLPDGSSHTLVKFAPMGSALCFPVQCLIFFGVILLVSTKWLKEQQGDTSVVSTMDVDRACKNFLRDHLALVPPGRLYSPAVYGDDLIIDHKISDRVIVTLESLGFEVNHRKSFLGSCGFRESCGIFAWLGHDVTPLLYRPRAEWRGGPSSRQVGFVDLINRARDHGLSRLRRHLIDVGRRLGMTFCYTDNPCYNDRILVDGMPYNAHLRSRMNKDLQRHEVRMPIVSVDYIDEEKTPGQEKRFRKDLRALVPERESYLYNRWCYSALRPREVNPAFGKVAQRRDSRGTKLRWGWAPT
jgi:hypothetical protein